MDPLETYRSKRDFNRTEEPAGGTPTATGDSFVVQKHAARRLHYDVRLEVDGVMPSWAVPKGPSYDPKVKRLAMHVEDHPLDYRGFEGTIPRAEYGAGTVIVWDEGSYRNLTERDGRPVPMRQAIEAGHVSVWLEGTKLKGGWSLTRTGAGQGGKDAWIMVKRRDETADPGLDIEEAAPASVRTGRTLEEVAADAGAPTWNARMATWAPPMLAELASEAAIDRLSAEGEQWLYERKLDGLRCIAVRNGDTVELWSRNRLSFNRRFPDLVAAVAALPVDNVVLDGEIVAFDGGRTSFGRLQAGGAAVLCVFDVLHLLGRDTTGLPLLDRKNLLTKLLGTTGILRRVETLPGTGRRLLEEACRQGWEGLVAKRSTSLYRSGRASDWRKLKCAARQEFVIGGWTDPRNTRTGFGALLVGVYDDTGLRYAGKVGSGFDQSTLVSLQRDLLHRRRQTSPFVDPVKLRDAHWAEPELVAEIAFGEWTSDGKLRHPRFVGLRQDKDPLGVRRESPSD